MAMEDIASPYIWHSEYWARVLSQIENNKLPHALLFSGPVGVGKAKFGIALAHLLLCQQPKEGIACGRCKSCLLNKSDTHPDFQPIGLEDKAKAIKIDQIRSLNSFMSKTPQQGGYRVVLINPCNAMNVNAANALLKTLEEPGSNSLLILVTDQINSVVPTIRSRCQHIAFTTPNHQEGLAWLGNIIPNSDEANTLLTLSGGSPLKALAIRESGELELRHDIARDLTAILHKKSHSMAVAESWKNHDIEQVLLWWQRLLNDTIRSMINPIGDAQDNVTKGLVMVLLGHTSTTSIFMLLDDLTKALQLARSSANPNQQLLLEHLLNRWSQLPNL